MSDDTDLHGVLLRTLLKNRFKKSKLTLYSAFIIVLTPQLPISCLKFQSGSSFQGKDFL